ncbi:MULTISPECIES: hypothetical protein [unclassified Cryobacterium]|uniref:hypothetical protein n=1 Tax=unclassified Cryobacterium TaxID=2649013 RepID=UPI000CE3C6C0|nr:MULTISPECIES: hypothetical protein [unclassified Cryobacterium]
MPSFEAQVGIGWLSTAGGSNPAKFLISEPDADALNRVRVAQPTGEAGTIQAQSAPGLDGIIVSGATLAQVGLHPLILLPETALLFELHCVFELDD